MGQTTLGDREKFLATGKDGYLAKPLVMEQLRDLLDCARGMEPTANAAS